MGGRGRDPRGAEVKLSEDEWRYLFGLRSDLEDEEDRRALRRLIRYAETLKRRLERVRAIVGDEDDGE